MEKENLCQAHSGVNAKVDAIAGWQRHHDEVVHVRIDQNLEDLAKRLPNWATLIMSGMGTIIGYLVALVRFSGGG